MITQGALYSVTHAMSQSLQKLSTGMRINTAADDAAGLGVSENLRTQVTGMSQALKNTQDAISVLNIADGALNEQAAILQRMRELVIQAKNDTYSSTERGYMGQEFSNLVSEIDRIAASTSFNGMQIFATPEMSGNFAGNSRLYNDTSAGASPETAHKVQLAGNAWTNSSDAVFGENDLASANHFNMMIGGNIGNDLDGDVYHVATESFEKSAQNMITIQFGQMDSNGLFSINPSGRDGSNIFDGFDFKTRWNGYPGALEDTEDRRIAIGTGGDPATATVQDKLQLMLQIIDGDVSSISANMQTMVFGNATSENQTGFKRINSMRAQVGAMTNRLEHAVNNLMNQITCTQSAESLIRDTDFASEMSKFTKNQILTQSATAMLAQANSSKETALKLIQ
jgi:flagellin